MSTPEKILNKMTPKVAKAFADAMADISNSVVLSRLISALERNDIRAALSELNIEKSAFRKFQSAIVAAYEAAGVVVVGSTIWRDQGRRKMVVRWNMENPRAEQYIANISSQLITSLVDGQVGSARLAILEGYSQGQGPRQIALDIVGRKQINGKRAGGVIGLDAQQQATRARVMQRLESGDYGSLLNMTNRDRSLDKMLKRGQVLNAKQKARYLRVHTNKALKARGVRIARTETAIAVERGRYDGFQQGLDKTGYPKNAVVKTWLHGGGGLKPRDWHVAMDGRSVRGLDTPFYLPDGSVMQHTHDSNGGSKNVIACTCATSMRVDYNYGRV